MKARKTELKNTLLVLSLALFLQGCGNKFEVLPQTSTVPKDYIAYQNTKSLSERVTMIRWVISSATSNTANEYEIDLLAKTRLKNTVNLPDITIQSVENKFRTLRDDEVQQIRVLLAKVQSTPCTSYIGGGKIDQVELITSSVTSPEAVLFGFYCLGSDKAGNMRAGSGYTELTNYILTL